MPQPPDDTSPSSTPFHSLQASFLPTVPVHEAQHRQNTLAQQRRQSLEDGHELEDFTPPTHDSNIRHNSRTSTDRSTRVPPLRIPASSSTSLPSPTEFASDSDDQMPSKKTRRNAGNNTPDRGASSSAHILESPNGSANGEMNGLLEHRRKHSPLDDPSSPSQAQHLMGRDTFSLDDDVPEKKKGDGEAIGFFDMPMQDRRNFLLLVGLYFLQGIPMGLAMGSVPFLLKPFVGYSEIGIFSLASYPYSLKLLWSPLVDAIWSPKVGRRKSWILPIQTLSGFGMLYLSTRVATLMKDAGTSSSGVWEFTWWWFSLVFMCATQDIAVDGWALTLLSPENISYASTAQTVGLTAGQFMSYTVFLAFNSKDFANKWFRTTPLDVGLLTLPSYLWFWGWAYLVATLGLALLKREDRARNSEGVWDVYKVMGGILKLRNIQLFIVVHLIAKIGFQANDGVTNLKLLDKGFSQEDLALTVLIDFPFEIALGYYAGQWSQRYQPMSVWCWAFIGRLFAAVFAQFTVMIFPAGGTTTWYLLLVIIEHVFSTFMNTVMFVAISAFHAKISDPVIGGTYMTLLATVSNLGGTFPRIFVLKFVDWFTVATCHPPTVNPPDMKSVNVLDGPFSCVAEPEKARCTAGGGSCTISIDGYYIVNILCVVVGALTFATFIRPTVLKLQALPLKAWRLAAGR